MRAQHSYMVKFFLEQLHDFVDDEHPTNVCWLVKVFYGFRQSSRVWNCKFNRLFTIHHFIPSIANPCEYMNNIDLVWFFAYLLMIELHVVLRWTRLLTFSVIWKECSASLRKTLGYMLVCTSWGTNSPRQFTLIRIDILRRFWSSLAFRMQHQWQLLTHTTHRIFSLLKAN